MNTTTTQLIDQSENYKGEIIVVNRVKIMQGTSTITRFGYSTIDAFLTVAEYRDRLKTFEQAIEAAKRQIDLEHALEFGGES